MEAKEYDDMPPRLGVAVWPLSRWGPCAQAWGRSSEELREKAARFNMR